MSQASNGNGDFEEEESMTFADALLLLGVAILLIAFPVTGYFFGSLIGSHMQLTDVSQGFTSGAVVYTVYNVTHNPLFNEEAQVLTAMGINVGNNDLNTSEMLGLTGGLIADFFVIYAFRNLLRKVRIRK